MTFRDVGLSPFPVGLVGGDLGRGCPCIPARLSKVSERLWGAARVTKPSRDVARDVLSLLLMSRTPLTARSRSRVPTVPHLSARIPSHYIYEIHKGNSPFKMRRTYILGAKSSESLTTLQKSGAPESRPTKETLLSTWSADWRGCAVALCMVRTFRACFAKSVGCP